MLPLEFPTRLPASILSEAPTPDQTLGQRDPLVLGRSKPFISWLHPPPPHTHTRIRTHPYLNPSLPPLVLHLSPHFHWPPRPLLGLPSLSTCSLSAPRAVISRRKHNVECQLPLSSLARRCILRIPYRPTTTRSAGEVNHWRHKHERVGIVRLSNSVASWPEDLKCWKCLILRRYWGHNKKEKIQEGDFRLSLLVSRQNFHKKRLKFWDWSPNFKTKRQPDKRCNFFWKKGNILRIKST